MHSVHSRALHRPLKVSAFIFLLMVQAFFLLTGKASTRRSNGGSVFSHIVVQSFRPSLTSVTPSSVAARRLAGARLRTTTALSFFKHPSVIGTAGSIPSRPFSTIVQDATVDRDLDTALDEIIGTGPQAVSEKKSPRIVKVKSEANNEDINYEDPELLNIRNPRWQARGVPPAIIDILASKGIENFTPVQAKAFDPIVKRRDVIGRSRTGTGKTIAFGLPAMIRLVDFLEKSGKQEANGRFQRGRNVSMIVLCPTRELARQVQEELKQIADPLGLFVECFHGGVSYDPQARALRQGLDILVGTPGRVMDHLERGNLDLSECDVVVLDEADEMLNMGFAEDVEVILKDVGSKNTEKTQCLLFSATTPPWVKEIGRQYQSDVVSIDATGDDGGLRVAKTVKHLAIQLPPGADSKKSMLEDIIAVHIVRDSEVKGSGVASKVSHSMQQKIFGKTIVFTETKREADELVSGGVFKSLTAQALHGDVGQKQRDATLNAFREGAFNVLVATDVAARGIDIKDVDLVIQFDPPRDVDTYVHRSGRTGRAGKSGVSILLFNQRQSREIVNIERQLGHGFSFGLIGPPSVEAALNAAARTSALACSSVSDDVSKYFKGVAADLLSDGRDPEDVVAKCLAAISRRSTEVQSRSLITGEVGFATIEMSNERRGEVTSRDVMYAVGKLSRLSFRDGDLSFESDVGKIQYTPGSPTALFDMGVEDAKKLVEFSKNVDTEGSVFKIIHEMEIERDHNFGKGFDANRRGGGRGGRGGGGRPGRDFNRGQSGGPRSSGGRNENGGYRGGGRDRQSFNDKRGDRNFRGRYDGGRGGRNNDGW